MVAGLKSEPDICIAISGSVARGAADRYSDLDIWLVVATADRLAAAREAVVAAIEQIGNPITRFAATHLGVENLLIFFTELDGQVVKLDVEIITASALRRPRELLPLHDPDGMFAHLPERESPGFNLDEANRRVAGWLWYAYTKAARGELFEAVDALDVLRKLAFVPLLLHHAGAEVEGYRRLERKLDSATLDIIRRTYSSEMSATAIIRALKYMGLAFRNAQFRLAVASPAVT